MEQFVAEEVGAENVSLVSIKEYIKKVSSVCSRARPRRAGPNQRPCRRRQGGSGAGHRLGASQAPPAPAVTQRNGKV